MIYIAYNKLTLNVFSYHWRFGPSLLWHCCLSGRKGIRPVKNMGDGGGAHSLVWIEWRLAGLSVSASVNLPLHYKVQKFSSGTGSPGCSRKGAVKWLWWWWFGWLMRLFSLTLERNSHVLFLQIFMCSLCYYYYAKTSDLHYTDCCVDNFCL